MTNFGAKILSNATRALAAQQAVIATIGNNIANVNTPGYARRVVDLQTAVSNSAPGTLNIGNGVVVGDIQRIADNFIENLLRGSVSTVGSSQIEYEFLQRLEGLFNVSGTNITIGSALTNFFASINDLTVNPSSLELRKNVMERAQDVVDAIKTTYNTIAGLQAEADRRLTGEVDNVNSLTSQIATLNGLISQREATGITAGDERDRRDILLTQLAEKISFSLVEASDGSVTISLTNGFSLVNGTNSRSIELTNNPSFAAGNLPPSLGGEVLRHIVFDYDPGVGTAHLDLTQILKAGGGSIGGLLKIRGYNAPANDSAFEADGILVEMASRVEAITRQLLTTFNQTYLGPDEDPGGVHDPSSADLDGNPPSVYGFFTWAPQNAAAFDVNGNGLPDDIDNIALGVNNFSSILELTFSDPRRLAAALDSDPAAASTSFEQGNGENAAALAALELDSLNFGLGGFGSFTSQTTFAGMFQEAVTHVGNAKSRAQLNESVAGANFLAIQSRRDQISGVSLDEEFTSLIQFQKAYQASARMIKVADDLLSQILQLI